MPEYDSDDERPDREAIYEQNLGESLPDEFEVSRMDRIKDPKVRVNMTQDGETDLTITDKRTREPLPDKVHCRVSTSLLYEAELSSANFDTLDEAEKWLIQRAEQVLEWQQDGFSVAQYLDREVRLDN